MGVNVIQVTFDGGKQRHNYFRRHEVDGDTFDKIFRNLLAIKETSFTNFVIIVRCNYSKDLYYDDQIDEFIKEYLNSFDGDDRFKLQLRPIVEYEKWGRNKKELLTYIGNISYLIDKAKNFEIFDENLLDWVVPRSMWCPIFKPNNLTINSKGEIYLCDAVISDQTYRIGHIGSNGTLIMHQGVDSKETHLSYRCKKCKRLPICFGTCNLIKRQYEENACCCTDEEIYELLTYLLTKKRCK